MDVPSWSLDDVIPETRNAQYDAKIFVHLPYAKIVC